MKLFKIRVFSLSVLLLLSACTSSPSKPSHSGPTVLVSIAPYVEIVNKIGGGRIQAQAIVPPGANPHTYEPTIRQASQAAQGSLWFRIGEPFEAKLLAVLKERNPSLVDADLGQTVSLLGCGCKCAHAAEDRHIWLSPKSLISQADFIAKTLGKTFPEHKIFFEENANLLIQDLKHLDAELQAALKDAKHRSFLVSHPAFAYFCKDYGLTQRSIEHEGKDPTAQHLNEIREQIQNEKILVGFAMPEHSNKGLEILAKSHSLSIQTLDPYSADYASTLKLLAQTISHPDAKP